MESAEEVEGMGGIVPDREFDEEGRFSEDGEVCPAEEERVARAVGERGMQC